MSIEILTVNMGDLPTETRELIAMIADDEEQRRLNKDIAAILRPEGERAPIPEWKVDALLCPGRVDLDLLN